MPEKNKIFLVDDHPLVREWLANLINEQSDLQVCGGAGNAPEAFQLIGVLKPGVVIVDLSLAAGSGLDLVKDIKAAHPGVTTIVLSMHDESLYAERALRAGARGYIMKREATKNVLRAVRAVLEGKLFVSDKIATQMTEKFVEGRPAAMQSPVEQLSDRELEVFQLLGCGHNTRQIADRLHVNFKTVQAYCARIKEKLDLANINELLCQAVRWHENQQTK